jgi:nicotinamidase/pyrazinamidase
MARAPANTAYVIVDMQNDFVLPTGALVVSGASSLVPTINSLRGLFDTVVWTLDWHPPDHVSFVTNHPGRSLYEIIDTPGYSQCLWPVHCVTDTPGAALLSSLDVRPHDIIVKKGSNPGVDSYSCFFDVIKSSSTDAHQRLQERGISTLYMIGIATDFCFGSSVVDAIDLGYNVFVIEDGIAAVDPEGGARKIAEMKAKGAKFVKSSEVKF